MGLGAGSRVIGILHLLHAQVSLHLYISASIYEFAGSLYVLLSFYSQFRRDFRCGEIEVNLDAFMLIRARFYCSSRKPGNLSCRIVLALLLQPHGVILFEVWYLYALINFYFSSLLNILMRLMNYDLELIISLKIDRIYIENTLQFYEVRISFQRIIELFIEY